MFRYSSFIVLFCVVSLVSACSFSYSTATTSRNANNAKDKSSFYDPCSVKVPKSEIRKLSVTNLLSLAPKSNLPITFKIPKGDINPIKSVYLTKNKIPIVITSNGRVITPKLADSMAFSADSRWISLFDFGSKVVSSDWNSKTCSIAIGFDEKIVYIKLNKPYEPKVLSGLPGKIFDLKLHPFGDSLNYSVGDSRIYSWKYLARDSDEISFKESRRRYERYVGHGAIVSSLAYHPFGRVFFSGGWDGALFAWVPYDGDSFQGKYDKTVFRGKYFSDDTKKKIVLTSPGERIVDIEVSTDGNRLLAVTSAGVIEVWNVRGFRKIVNVFKHSGPVKKVAFIGNSDFFISYGKDKNLFIWKIYKSSISASKIIYKAKVVKSFKVRDLVTTFALNDGSLLVARKNGAVSWVKVQ